MKWNFFYLLVEQNLLVEQFSSASLKLHCFARFEDCKEAQAVVCQDARGIKIVLSLFILIFKYF